MSRSSALLWVTLWITIGCAYLSSTAISDDAIDPVVSLLEFVLEDDAETAADCIATLTAKIVSGELNGPRLETLRRRLRPKLVATLESGDPPKLYEPLVLLSAAWGDAPAARVALGWIQDRSARVSLQIAAMESLAASRSELLLSEIPRLIRAEETSGQQAGHLLDMLARYPGPQVPQIIFSLYDQLAPAHQARAVEVLLTRPPWSKALLQAIGRDTLPANALHVNQVVRLLASQDPEITQLVEQLWGTVRLERNPQRIQVLEEMTAFLNSASGNPEQGQLAFDKLCGQCHLLHGKGHDVGPDITRNGRGSFEQLLSNVFDPSLVIGAAYQARTVITADGRVLTGLVAEDNRQRVVLKTQGGKREIIPRRDVEETQVSALSLMPEGVEKQLTLQQIADLFAFLSIEGPLEQIPRQTIPGTPPELVAE